MKKKLSLTNGLLYVIIYDNLGLNMRKNKKEHYVDNEKFLGAISKYNKKCKGIELEFRDVNDYDSMEKMSEEDIVKLKRLFPPITEYIGDCFLKIAVGLSYKPNFINYTYRDEMISDGIENCIQYCRNFNAEKSKNPFSYFTQIIYYAFVRRIEREKKQAYIKHKLTYESGILEEIIEIDPDMKLNIEYQKNDFFDIYEFEEKMDRKRKSRKMKSKNSLESFME